MSCVFTYHDLDFLKSKVRRHPIIKWLMLHAKTIHSPFYSSLLLLTFHNSYNNMMPLLYTLYLDNARGS